MAERLPPKNRLKNMLLRAVGLETPLEEKPHELRLNDDKEFNLVHQINRELDAAALQASQLGKILALSYPSGEPASVTQDVLGIIFLNTPRLFNEINTRMRPIVLHDAVAQMRHTQIEHINASIPLLIYNGGVRSPADKSANRGSTLYHLCPTIYPYGPASELYTHNNGPLLVGDTVSYLNKLLKIKRVGPANPLNRSHLAMQNEELALEQAASGSFTSGYYRIGNDDLTVGWQINCFPGGGVRYLGLTFPAPQEARFISYFH